MWACYKTLVTRVSKDTKPRSLAGHIVRISFPATERMIEAATTAPPLRLRAELVRNVENRIAIEPLARQAPPDRNLCLKLIGHMRLAPARSAKSGGQSRVPDAVQK